MSETPWVDHYETLQLSACADAVTVERVYRLLAKRYHPDNDRSGDAERFYQVREAYETLSDPEKRAAYDATYEADRSRVWELFRQDSAGADRDDDQRLFHGILSLLYIARRRDPTGGGMAPMHLERLLDVDREHLNFPLWYLKERGHIETLENGLIAISVEGIDKLGSGELSLPAHRLLAEHSVSPPRTRETERLPRYGSAS
jgi:hypothetical protein